MLRFLTAGESHGPSLQVIIEGLPSGLPVTVEGIAAELGRRRLGYGRGPRMRFEQDEVSIVGGVRHGRTLGSPIGVIVANSEWPKWEVEMGAGPGAPSKILTRPRPGHADLPGMLKYGFADARDVLERSSARETAARVVVGAVAKSLLASIGIEVVSHVIALGGVLAKDARPGPGGEDLAAVDASEVRCFDPDAAQLMIEAIKAAAKDGDSLGGIAEVIAYGVPLGLGSHVHYDRRMDGLLAQAVMSIHAVKSVEIGEGATVTHLRGSQAHDAIGWDAATESYVRPTNRAGGLEGGISNGQPIVVRSVMKPLSTLNRPVIGTVDVVTKEEALAFRERTDVTAVPAMGVIAESMVALVLAGESQRKFGGDTVDEFVRNHAAYVEHLGETPSAIPEKGDGSGDGWFGGDRG